MEESTTLNIKLLANDRRWELARSVLDIVAILNDLEDHRKFIDTHAIRANPLDIAVNLFRIHQEAEGQAANIEKIRRYLYRLYEALLKDIYSDPSERETEMNNGKNGHQKTVIKSHRRKKGGKRRKFRGSGKRAREKTSERQNH